MAGDLNTIVFNTAKSKKGRSVKFYKVTNCWSFVERTLYKSGAMTSNDYMGASVSDPNADYQWGEISKIKSITSAKPGDILQFKNYSVTCQITKLPEKPGEYEISEDVPVMPFHSAIVHTPIRNGKIKVIHQNWDNAKKVILTDLIVKDGTYKEGELEFDCKVKGRITVYTPEKK